MKVGDFGISKMMTSANGGGASTVLGTPYYISPEMVSHYFCFHIVSCLLKCHFVLFGIQYGTICNNITRVVP